MATNNFLNRNEFWKNPQHWIYAGVAVLIGVGAIIIFSSYNRPKTEAEIKADVLKSLATSEQPPVSAKERDSVLRSLRTTQPPVVSEEDKTKVLEALRGAQ